VTLLGGGFGRKSKRTIRRGSGAAVADGRCPGQGDRTREDDINTTIITRSARNTSKQRSTKTAREWVAASHRVPRIEGDIPAG